MSFSIAMVEAVTPVGGIVNSPPLAVGFAKQGILRRAHLGIEPQGLVLVVHVRAGQFDFHLVAPGSPDPSHRRRPVRHYTDGSSRRNVTDVHI